MISFIFSKAGAFVIGGAIVALIIGWLLFRVQSLTADVANAEKKVAELDGQLTNAKVAVEECKGTVAGKDAEISGCQEQARAVVEAVDAYKERLDRLSTLSNNWKSVPINEQKGILDASSNAEAVRELNTIFNARAVSPSPGVRKDASKN